MCVCLRGGMGEGVLVGVLCTCIQVCTCVNCFTTIFVYLSYKRSIKKKSINLWIAFVCVGRKRHYNVDFIFSVLVIH